jgi:hypothetical protein
MRTTSRRNFLHGLGEALMLSPFVAGCNGKLAFSGEIVLSAVLYSYASRPIFDVLLNRCDIGLANGYGRGGIMTGVIIPYGKQTLTWRLDGPKGAPRNGEVVSVKNMLSISEDQVPRESRYIGVHIYPDDSAELTFSKYIPDRTPRGERIISEIGKAIR